ncbi:sigma factor [Nonomuraea sp. NPDC050691]|uniref:sigma factor n=1 Tax=Nonomuraea sp. NPDC050691 TaxID=3155661 RepID=UPI0034027D2C
MGERDWLTERFEEHRPQRRAVAYRMLGSVSEVEDAVQDAWLRLDRADTSGLENLGAWLTTAAAGVVVTVGRRPLSIMAFTVTDGRIAAIDVLSDPERLNGLDLTVLDE